AHERWNADHADLFAYRDQLAGAVRTRQAHLSELAVREQPQHLTDLLGPIPDEPDLADRWAQHAGRVEAYREEWGIAPDELDTLPRDSVQRVAWSEAVRPALDRQRIEQQLAQRQNQQL